MFGFNKDLKTLAIVVDGKYLEFRYHSSTALPACGLTLDGYQCYVGQFMRVGHQCYPVDVYLDADEGAKSIFISNLDIHEIHDVSPSLVTEIYEFMRNTGY